MKRIFKLKTFQAFCYSLLLGLLIILPNIIVGGGLYSLISDYNYQQVPFNMLMANAIKEGTILWTWFNELGSNFIGTFSFYNLFSPFNVLIYPFPESIYPYLNPIIIILKYGVCGLTSYLFLARYCKNKNNAIIGSLLYTFSGFQLTNILFHFQDAIALFPLLLYTLDNYMYDNKKIWFGLTVALIAFTNWYFFIAEGVFLFLYFLVKIITKEYKIKTKKILNLVFEGSLGIGIAALVLIPTAIFISGNPRIINDWNISNMFTLPLDNMLEIIKALFLPNEAMNYRGFIMQQNYFGTEIYLPFVGILLVLGTLFKNYKKWYSILFIVCIIFMFIPILNNSFYLFNTAYYTRWYYMPILIMSLMSIKCIEEKINLKKPLLINIGLYILLLMGVVILNIKFHIPIYDLKLLLLIIIVSLISLFSCYYIIKKNKNPFKYILIGIFIYVTIWGNITTYLYKDKTLTSNYKEFLEIKNLNIEKNIRTNSSKSCSHNLGVVGKFNNIKTFNTNINSNSFNFYYAIDYIRTVGTEINDKKINDYLGVKQIISCNDKLDEYKLVSNNKIYDIYENPNYKKFGFNTNKYISENDFYKLTTKEKRNILGNKIILKKDQIKKYKDLYKNEVTYSKNNFKFIKNGFQSEIKSSGETLAIYTIPYDEGWKAKINNKKVKIEKVDIGMMGIKLNKGINNIEFKYIPKGLNIGIIISIISVLTYIIYILKCKNKKEQ